MLRKIAIANNKQVSLSIPESYVGKELEIIITPFKEREQTNKKERQGFGSLKGQIKISDDFDVPLVDFKEYM